VSANELEVALKASCGKDDRASTEIPRRALTQVLRLETSDPSVLRNKVHDLGVPYESYVWIIEACAVERHDEAQPTASRDVSAWHGVTWILAQTFKLYAHSGEPIVNVSARTVDVVANPFRIGIFAPFNKVLVGKIWSVADAALALEGSVDDRHIALRHHCVSAENRCHFDDGHLRTAIRGLESCREARNAGSDDQDVCIRLP
jgi:hypothetical protein